MDRKIDRYLTAAEELNEIAYKLDDRSNTYNYMLIFKVANDLCIYREFNEKFIRSCLKVLGFQHYNKQISNNKTKEVLYATVDDLIEKTQEMRMVMNNED